MNIIDKNTVYFLFYRHFSHKTTKKIALKTLKMTYLNNIEKRQIKNKTIIYFKNKLNKIKNQ